MNRSFAPALTPWRSGTSSLALLPLLLLTASACGDAGAAAGASAPVVVDSAGVQIVTSSDPAWTAGEEWRLSAAPTLEIGMAEGPNEYLFSRIRSARRRADGAVLVGNGQTAEIRVFDPEGRYVQSIGRRGEGPGEFNDLFWFTLLPGDSIVAYDLRSRRISLFTAEGGFVRSTTMETPEGGSLPFLLGMFPDRSLVVTIRDFGGLSSRDNEATRTPERYLRVNSDGELLDTLSRLPGTETYTQRSAMSGGMQVVMMNTALFGRASVAALVGDRLVLGSNDSYELRVVTPEGRLERLIRRSVAVRPVTDEMLAAAQRDRLEDVSDEAERRRQQQSIQNAPHGATVPFYDRLLGDDAGNLWVQEFTVPGEPPAGWAVYDPEGALLGNVQLPQNFRMLHIGPDFVLGVATDELGVERVRLYGLEKGAAR